MKDGLTSPRAAVVAALLAAGCSAPPQRWGEWIDPALGSDSGVLRDGKVLVACETFDLAARAQCQDNLQQALQARGAQTVAAPMDTTAMNPRDWEGQLAASANAAGARTVFVLSLTPATTSMGSGMSVGVGGFSFGRGSGAGIGLSAPIGGWGSTGFSATGRVSDVRNGRMVWTSTFAASPSSDFGGQFRDLTRTVLDAAQAAGLL
ncbi:hypothetical protein QTI33_26385 [Variovorax sp. J22P271]|uniref:hypothetical protein n=1 Tax=Variovorax davisae TaxID=3053515 RepID=UPI002576850A|nr:hypothetical protein [Variovorax sp. J22P271]MDM0035689.1 hypothetical protein [Variovorax sp. J22P271]